jgi:hypothetical protein
MPVDVGRRGCIDATENSILCCSMSRPMDNPGQMPLRRDVDRATFESRVVPGGAPVVFKGLVAEWPLVRAALESRHALAQAVKTLDAGREPYVIEAPAGVDGRIFYREDLAGFNFTRRPAGIGATVDRLLQLAETSGAPAVFLESLPANAYLPGFAGAHRMPLLDARVEPRVWIGNAVKINTHFDLAYNIACVAGGRRRFTLFPPDQIENLYIAPLDFTPSGAPVSLVQLTNPDLARFPRFAEALRHAVQAELEPGDALYIPFGWWHHVESLTPFNVLVNYWWDDAPSFGAPHGALLHALLTIRDLPSDQRGVWDAIFRHLVFSDPERALSHLLPAQRGMLAPPSTERTRKIRQTLAREFKGNESSEAAPGGSDQISR